MMNELHPRISEDARISPSAIIEGDVLIGSGTCILSKAVIVSQGAPVIIGNECVIMENAIVRGVSKYSCFVGNRVLIGPHSHISGATIGDGVFLGTGAVVLNGAELEAGVVVRIHGTVQIGAKCPKEMIVPIGFIAAGNPAVVESPADNWSRNADLGFTEAVFGFDSSGWGNREATEEVCRRYTAFLKKR